MSKTSAQGSVPQDKRERPTQHDLCRHPVTAGQKAPHMPPLWGVAVPVLCPANPAPTPISATCVVLHKVIHAMVSVICQSLSYHFETPTSQTLNTHLQSPESPPIPPGAEVVCQCARTNYFPADTGQHLRKNS